MLGINTHVPTKETQREDKPVPGPRAASLHSHCGPAAEHRPLGNKTPLFLFHVENTWA